MPKDRAKMTLDPDERACTLCGCVEHKDGGRRCEACHDWACDACVEDEWPEDTAGDRRLCKACWDSLDGINEDGERIWRER